MKVEAEWYPSEEVPESDGEFVDVWISLEGGRIISGKYLHNPDDPIEEESHMWFDDDQYLLNPATVQYWALRRDAQKPEPPR